MFKLFNRHRFSGTIVADKPENSGIAQPPLKLRLELDFLDSTEAGEVDESKLVILPSTLQNAERLPEFKIENEREEASIVSVDSQNQKEVVEPQTIPESEVQRSANGIQSEVIGAEKVIEKPSPELSKSDNQEEIVVVQEAGSEISIPEINMNTGEGENIRTGISHLEINPESTGNEINIKGKVAKIRKGVAAYQSQQWIHGPSTPASVGETMHSVETNNPEKEDQEDLKTESRYSGVLPKILELARGDPGVYGCKKHSLRKLRKYLIRKGIANISHETLRRIITNNGIYWNRNGCHKKKEEIVVIDANPSRSIPASMKSPGKTEYLDEPENPLVAKPYDLVALNDYMKPNIVVLETGASSRPGVMESAPEESKDECKGEKIVGVTASADDIRNTGAGKDVDVDVPPGIEGEINNIKSFGVDFDPEKLNVIDSYSLPNPIESPMVYIVKDGFKLRYLIKEPVKPAIYGSVRDAILRNIDLCKANEENPIARLNSIVDRLKKKYSELKNLSLNEERALKYYLFRDFIGYREIDVPMNDDNIEDITCVGYGIPVFIYHQKYYNLISDIVLPERELDAMVLRLAQEGGKHISISDPIIDATLRNGARAQLTFKKTATDKGSTFTLRRFRSSHITPVDLIEKDTYTPEAMAYLWKSVQSGKNILIIGGTATGKTTNLNACSLFIPPEVKIVSIEDTREIKLYQKNWIPSVTTRDIDTFSLLKAALRQRPEYIIVGEVRGKEAQTLFQAMTSGHVVMSTFHAGSVADMVNRLTSSPIEVPPAMLESLDIIVVLKNEWTNTSSRHRFADAIYEQRRIKGIPRFVEIYSHENGLSASLINPEIEGKIQCLYSLIKEGVLNPDKVSERIISQMYSASAPAPVKGE